MLDQAAKFAKSSAVDSDVCAQWLGSYSWGAPAMAPTKISICLPQPPDEMQGFYLPHIGMGGVMPSPPSAKHLISCGVLLCGKTPSYSLIESLSLWWNACDDPQILMECLLSRLALPLHLHDPRVLWPTASCLLSFEQWQCAASHTDSRCATWGHERHHANADGIPLLVGMISHLETCGQSPLLGLPS